VDLSEADSLAISGATSDRIYVSELEQHLNGNPTTSLVGYFDLNLENGHWKRFDSPKGVQTATLRLNSQDNVLTFSAFPNGDSVLDAIQLDPDLKPPVGGACQPFLDVSVATQVPQMTVETLALTQSALTLAGTNSTTEFTPTTRIQLQSLAP